MQRSGRINGADGKLYRDDIHVGIVEGRDNALLAEVCLFELPRTFGKGHYCLIRTYARERSVLNEERLRVRPGLVHCVNISVVE